MAQVCTIIQADPDTLAVELAALNAEVLILEKTSSAGKFIVIHQTPSTSQNFAVVAGDPDTISLAIGAIVTGGDTVQIVSPTFSASKYLVVSV